MADNVSFVVDLGVKPGQLDNFRGLVKEMVASVRSNEPGTLSYEWFLSDDGAGCHIYERYTDSAAALQHLGNLQQTYLERLLGAVDVKRFMVYGDANRELREVLGGMGAIFLPQMEGFSR